VRALGLAWIRGRLGDLRVRLRQARLPSISLPAAPAAAASPEALAQLERGALKVIDSMLLDIDRLDRSLAKISAASARQTQVANRRLTVMQLRADALFKSLDFFSDTIAIRADAHSGLLLAGLDRVLAVALDRKIPGYRPPHAISYLDAGGRGGAISRARTRLPGGVVLPVAMVRVSPETLPTRLTSSLHEVGHQLAVDLNMLEEARHVVRRAVLSATGNPAQAALWVNWTGELIPDCWSLCLGAGAPAVDGVQRVLSLPAPMLHLLRPGAVHPPGAVRVPFSVAYARHVRPDPVLRDLSRRFDQVYAGVLLPDMLVARTRSLATAVDAVAEALATHRFTGLAGRTISEVSDPEQLDPRRLRTYLAQASALDPEKLAARQPLFALAAIGLARTLGLLAPAHHDRIARAWLLNIAQRHAKGRSAAVRSELQGGRTGLLSFAA